MQYEEMIEGKRTKFKGRGIEQIPALNEMLFPYQKHVVEFLLKAGRGAAFLDTGLGKTLIQLEVGRVISEVTNLPFLILAPLCVGPQTEREAEKFGINARYVRDKSQIDGPGVYITNYERLHLFDTGVFGGVALDESSILKSFMGATFNRLCDAFEDTPYRFCFTATPAPNDHMELGQHSTFLGIMPSNEMLSKFFITDQSSAGKYRLKGHAVKPFWDWVASWARCATLPSDLGDSDEGFILEPFQMEKHNVKADLTKDTGNMLFRIPDSSATSIHKEKRRTITDRAQSIAQAVMAEHEEPWIIWCDTDYEADALIEAIPGAVEVRGGHSQEHKEKALMGFSDGSVRVLITKPKIAGFGLNWQHCARVGFVGLSYSYESFYQALRRCWRFGQKRKVVVHCAIADTEREIYDSIIRKQGGHEEMKKQMRLAMARSLGHAYEGLKAYNPKQEIKFPNFLRTK